MGPPSPNGRPRPCIHPHPSEPPFTPRHPRSPLSLPPTPAARGAVLLALLLAARRRARRTAHHRPPSHPRHRDPAHDRRPRGLQAAIPTTPPPPRQASSGDERDPPHRGRTPPLPQRPRGRLLRALAPPPSPHPRDQRQARALGGRLSLARRAPRRRSGLLRLPPGFGRFRGRPRPRARPPRRRLHRPPLHGHPARKRTRPHRRRGRSGADHRDHFTPPGSPPRWRFAGGYGPASGGRRGRRRGRRPASGPCCRAG
jgi:hypothetical protein